MQGEREEGFVKVQDDRDSTGSELYSLINAILKGCIKENMVSPKLDTIKKIMGDFNGEEIFCMVINFIFLLEIMKSIL